MIKSDPSSLRLKGELVENLSSTATPVNPVVLLHRDGQADPLSFVDRSGNLKVRHSTYSAGNPDMTVRRFD
jgi:hypothetical protein